MLIALKQSEFADCCFNLQSQYRNAAAVCSANSCIQLVPMNVAGQRTLSGQISHFPPIYTEYTLYSQYCASEIADANIDWGGYTNTA